VPRFYGDRAAWLSMVRHTVSVLAPELLATRMVRDYVGELYTPAAAEARRLQADDHAGARRLAEFRARVRAAWGGVAVMRSELGEATAASAPVAVRALVTLGGLEPGDVTVEAVGHGPAPFAVVLEPAGDEDDARWFEGSFLAPQGSSGVRVRVLPRQPDLTDPRTLGLVAQDHD